MSGTEITEPKASELKSISPYQLSSSDNPGSVISSVILKGNNYNEWAAEFLNALQAKRKLGFINGNLRKPVLDDPDYENWLAVNSMIVGWIRSSIEPKLRSTVTYITDAYQLWIDLKKRFSVGNQVRLHQIKSQLAICKQEGQSVMEYFGKLSALWEELQNYQPVISCTCSAAPVFAKAIDEEKIHQFVMGLDESRFGNLCSSIISTDPLPDLGEVYAKIIREEQRLESLRSRETQQNAVGFVTRSNNGSDISPLRNDSILKDKNVLCAHCGRSGHEKKDCWQLIGFPEWWVEKNQRGRGRGGRGSRGKGSGRGQAIAAHATSSNASNLPDFTNEQWNLLTQMIQEKTASSSSDKLSGKTGFGDMILDTGASHHMTGNISFLNDLRTIPPCTVGFADGSRTMALQMGSFPLTESLTLHNVLYVPALNCSLVSVAKLLKQTGCFAMFSDTVCILQDRFSKTMIGRGEERDGVYHLTNIISAQCHRMTTSTEPILWHQRLGHPSFSALKNTDLFSASSFNPSCDVCYKAKQTRESFSTSTNNATDCFSLIHTDVWGPYRVHSTCGAVYFLTIVDDFSRAVWTYLLLEKSEVKTVLKQFIAYASKQFGKQVKIVRSDNGTEFMCLSSYFREQGIVHQTSCVGTPQQNGRVERKHRHILNVARALLFQSSLPTKFWGEAVMTSAYLINRTPSALLQGKSPYEILHGEKPNYSLLRVFGCACYTHHRDRAKDKFSSKSRSCVFIGYSHGQKGWKVYDHESQNISISRDIIFREDVFPFKESKSDTIQLHEDDINDSNWLPNVVNSPSLHDDESSNLLNDQVNSDKNYDNKGSSTTRNNNNDDNTTPSLSSSNMIHSASASSQEREVQVSSTLSSPTANTNSQTTKTEELGLGHRVKKSYVRLQDFVTYNSFIDPHALPNSTL